ncbi:hypothetical protein F5884DRAFT_265510 [Xylogone sp. PMI_703]|nr:hypothetical protein F5884DRAFT_265510 [Xylogone sp. PMI_703]
MALNLTFITTTGPSLGYDDERLVRAHTTRMNFTRRRQRLSQMYSARSHSVANPIASKLLGKSQTGKKGTVNTLSRHGIDILPAVNPPLTRTLLDENTFFISYLLDSSRQILFALDVANVPPEEGLKEADWFDLISSEPAMLEASLYLAANVHNVRVSKSSNSVVVNSHRGQAIRLVNERLNDLQTALSDGIMGAVFTLAFSDQLAGDHDSCKVHLSGLERMLQVRLSTWQSRPVAWLSNLIVSTAMSTAVRLPDSTYGMQNIISITDSLDGACDGVIRAATLILAHVHGLISRINSSSTFEGRDWHAAISCHLLQIEQLISMNSKFQYLQELSPMVAVLLGCKIFLEYMLSPCGESLVSQEERAVELMHSLKAPGIHLCSSLDLALWQLMMGAILKSELEIHAWYIMMLRRAVHALQITSWREALDILRKSFWVEHVFAEPCHSIWLEVTTVPQALLGRTENEQMNDIPGSKKTEEENH